MANGLFDMVTQTSLLGDVRDENFRKARELRQRAEENNLTIQESNQLRKNHPNTSYFDAYMNFNNINDPVITPLVNMVMNQPEKYMSDIFEFDDKEVERGYTVRGVYDTDTDKISLIRNPISEDIGRSQDYKPRALKRPFLTKISNDNTAAHEMIHAALQRNVSPSKFSSMVQHGFIDHQLAKSLVDNKDYWIEKYGEDDYKKEVTNYLVTDAYKTGKPKGGLLSLLKNLDSIDTNSLSEQLKATLDEKPIGAIKVENFLDLDEVKRITGTPESQKLRGSK